MGSGKPTKTFKKDSKWTAGNQQKVEWQGYVAFELSTAQKAAYKKAIEQGKDPLEWLSQICVDGTYTLKVDYRPQENCWRAALYCQKYGHPNAGWSLPCRAADFWEACRRLAYLHAEVLQGEWTHPADSMGWNDEKW